MDTAAGPLLITGCAHPGLADMVERAAQQAAKPINMVLGGFHLSTLSAGDVHSLAERLKELGVVRCAPAHCTGERATAILREEFGARLRAHRSRSRRRVRVTTLGRSTT